ncbi:hypothetical protein [Hyphococcus sp.]|jgi:cytochrome b561|uniref:hypothetical protein n=1 Tax=Hyphococcus sp. TaxID=2038636 RepID=UPI003D122360
MKTATSLSFAAPLSLLLFLAGLAALLWAFMTGGAIDPEKGREAMIAAIWNHVGWGVLAAPTLILYAGWRLLSGAAPRTSIMDIAAIAVLLALSAAILFLIVTGPITVWTYGSALKVFDWFAIPSPTGKAPELHSFVEQAHVFVARAVPWLAAADVALFAASRVAKR